MKAARFALLLAVVAAGVASPNAASADERDDTAAALRVMPDPANGKRLFVTCTQCHGAHRSGMTGSWVPEIAGQYRNVLVKELIDYRHGLRWDLRMQVVAGRHVLVSVQDIVDVATYVASLAPASAGRSGSGEWVRTGARLYDTQCAACHGATAQGDPSGIPRIAGQNFDYLLRQFHDAIEGRRPNMGAVHVERLQRLDMRALAGLADYLSRLPVGRASRGQELTPTVSQTP
jgi:cytochrome c553